MVTDVTHRELPPETVLGCPLLPRIPRYSLSRLSPFFNPQDLHRYNYLRTLSDITRNGDSYTSVAYNEVVWPYQPCQSITRSAHLRSYFGLLHSHTGDSDGTGNVEQAYATARDVAHLDFFAVTDHSDFWPVAYAGAWARVHQAAAAAERDDFVALAGFEYSNLMLGHYVVLETPDYHSAYSDRNLFDFYRWLKARAQKDAVVFFAHPGFHRYRRAFDLMHFALDPQLKQKMTGVEVIHMNVWGSFLSGYSSKSPYFDEALLQGWRLSPLASQDNHHGNWGVQDSTRIGVLLPSLSKKHLLQAIKERRTYATQNENLQFSVEMTTPSHTEKSPTTTLMGGTAPLNPPHLRRQVLVRYADPDGRLKTYALEVVSAGKVVGRLQVAPAPLHVVPTVQPCNKVPR